MPSNWQSVDSNFPSFTGEESPTQQIRALHNYLFCLKQELQYSLRNLTAENWNAAALDSLTEDAKQAVAGQLASISGQVAQLKVQVDSLQGRVTDMGDLSKRMDAVEENATYLEQRMETAEGNVVALQETAADHEQRLAAQETAVEDLSGRTDAVEADMLTMDADLAALTQTVTDLNAAMQRLQETVDGVIQTPEDGSTTLGKEGGKLYLVGEIYLNGVLLEQGGTDETT